MIFRRQMRPEPQERFPMLSLGSEKCLLPLTFSQIQNPVTLACSKYIYSSKMCLPQRSSLSRCGSILKHPFYFLKWVLKAYCGGNEMSIVTPRLRKSRILLVAAPGGAQALAHVHTLACKSKACALYPAGTSSF